MDFISTRTRLTLFPTSAGSAVFVTAQQCPVQNCQMSVAREFLLSSEATIIVHPATYYALRGVLPPYFTLNSS